MTTLSHERRTLDGARRALSVLVPEAWASIAIGVMWLTVLCDAVWGPSIDNASAGGDHSSVPSAVAIALFAFLGTWVVARNAFRHDRRD